MEEDNSLIVSFSEDMTMLDTIADADITHYMTGPLGNYDYSISVTFTDSKTVKIEIISSVVFTGADDEYLHVFFSDKFVSKNGATLYNNYTSGRMNEVVVSPDLVGVLGSSSNMMLTTIMVSIISTNILLSQS